MKREIKGKLPIKCLNCKKSNVFLKEKCSTLEKEKEDFVKTLGFENVEELYKVTKGHYSNEDYKRFSTFKMETESKIRIKGSCPFESQYIETPLSILNGIYIEDLYETHQNSKQGKLVKVRLASEDDKKTYLGVYLGDLPRTIGLKYKEEQKTMTVSGSLHNPAIWVFKLKKIVWGCQSWWGVIDDEKDFKEISDLDIDNVWYVKMLKSLVEEKDKKEN